MWFRLSGGPPNALGVGAEAIAPDRIRLPRAPWAALMAAKADVYRVQRGTDGQLWVEEKLDASGYCAIRLALTPDSPFGPLRADVDPILDKFTALGVTGCGMFGLAVIDVPPDADLYLVRRLLNKGQRDRWWDYDELHVTDAWHAPPSS